MASKAAGVMVMRIMRRRYGAGRAVAKGSARELWRLDLEASENGWTSRPLAEVTIRDSVRIVVAERISGIDHTAPIGFAGRSRLVARTMPSSASYRNGATSSVCSVCGRALCAISSACLLLQDVEPCWAIKDLKKPVLMKMLDLASKFVELAH